MTGLPCPCKGDLVQRISQIPMSGVTRSLNFLEKEIRSIELEVEVKKGSCFLKSSSDDYFKSKERSTGYKCC